MLSVNYISTFLSNKQDAIEKKYYNSINHFELNENFIKKKYDKTENNSSNDTFEHNNSNNNDTNNSNNSNKKTEKNETNIIKKYEPIYDALNYFFDTDSNIFSIYKKLENNNELYTFMNSIFSIGDEIFILNNFQNKKNIMKSLIKKMDDELLKDDLYFLYNYDKNRKFNKEKIMTVLKELYKFSVDRETIHLFKQYLSDYLGINIFVIGLINNNIDYDNKEFYLTHKYGLSYNKYAQTFILITENNLYYPLIKNTNNNFNGLNYEEIEKYLDKFLKFYDIKLEEDVVNKMEEINVNININNTQLDIENINNDDNDKINNNKIDKDKIKNDKINNDKIHNNKNINININIENELKKLKLEELRIKATEKKISIQKISDKTSKMINKTKGELIEELLKI